MTTLYDKFFIKQIENYRNDIDGIRGLAVLFVIFYHIAPKIIPGGFIGVDIFFVISGYLITQIIISKLINNTFSLKNFYLSRIRRIFPSLIFLLLFNIFIGNIALFPDEFKNLGKYILGGAIYVSNFILLDEIDYFNQLGITKPLLHLWSLAVEEQFYIIYPLFMIFLYHKFNKNVKKILFINLLILFSSIFINNIFKTPSIRFYLPITRFWEILFGSIISIFYQINFQVNHNKNYKIYLLQFIKKNGSIIGLLLIIIGLLLNRDRYNYFNYRYFFPVIGTIFLIISKKNSFINTYILSSRPIRYFGIISYPLYLWHWSLLSFYYIIFQQYPSFIYKLLIFILSTLLSTITYLYLEYNIRFVYKYRKIKHIILINLLLLIGCYGLFSYVTNGKYSLNFENYSSISLNIINKKLITKNDECFDYVNLSIKDGYIYCKYYNINADKTIAIIGDSHALSAYYGFTQFALHKNVNILLLSMSGKSMPLMYTKQVIESENYNNWEIIRNSYYDKLLNDNKISNVFIYTRGIIYFLGYDFDGTQYNDIIDINTFKQSIQNTVNILVDHNKKVFIVTEVPQLPLNSIDYLKRPLSIPFNTTLLKNNYIKYQKEYLNIINSLNNVTIINSLNILCPKNICKIFTSTNLPVYIDNNHLSEVGSFYLADYILNNYKIY